VHAGTFTNDSKVAEILGIPTLKQETSLSVSVGAVAKIAKGFDLKVNAYQNDIKNRIILSNTFNGGNNAALTNELNAAGAGTASIFTNGVDTRSRGLEAVLTHTTKFAHSRVSKGSCTPSSSRVGSSSGAVNFCCPCFHHPPRQTQRAHLTHCAFLVISSKSLLPIVPEQLSWGIP
jgi:hypothetical protein